MFSSHKEKNTPELQSISSNMTNDQNKNPTSADLSAIAEALITLGASENNTSQPIHTELNQSKLNQPELNQSELNQSGLNQNDVTEVTTKTTTGATSDPIDDAIAYNTITNQLLVPYTRQAMYYETDQMGIIHHSNYIRWFEESRIHFLEQIDLSYEKLENSGILIPVLGVSCEYKSSVRFNEKVIILPKITYFNGFKMTIKYQIMGSLDHTRKAYGESSHCFLNKEFKPINIKKDYKNIYDILSAWVN